MRWTGALNSRSLTVAVWIAIFASTRLQAQTFDLGEQIPGSVVPRSVEANANITLRLRGMVPKYAGKYSVSIGREQVALPSPLPLPDAQQREAQVRNFSGTMCAPLVAAAKAAVDAST